MRVILFIKLQGTVQDDTSERRMIDGKFKALLAAFAAAPALTQLHVQLPDHLAVASKSLVIVHIALPCMI